MSVTPQAIANSNADIVNAVNQNLPEANDDVVTSTLTAAGFDEFKDASLLKIEDVLRTLASLIKDDDDLRRATIREAALKRLDDIGIKAPGRLLDAALQRQQQQAPSDAGLILFADPEPWPEVVDGSE